MLTFNSVEEEIIRHPAFNRLADLKQLGYTYKGAYKCATHSRLSHSLGVAHLAKKILFSAIEKTRQLVENKKIDQKKFPTLNELDALETPEMYTLLGATALLHDINHTPFAHAIQTHLKLTDIIQSEERFQKNLDEFENCIEFNKELREKVGKVLAKSQRQTKSGFEYAELFHSIIRGDVGASTIDFIQRDTYETGHGRIPLFNLVDSFLLVNCDGCVKLALNITQTNEALTAIYNLLFTRYKLSETVYFHHTNIAAEAMIGKALRHLIRDKNPSKPTYSELDAFLSENKTDPDFFHALEKNQNASIKEIGKLLKERNLYFIPFTLKYSSPSEIVTYLHSNFRDRNDYKNHFILEEGIANKIGFKEQDIIVHCCDPNMYSFDIDNLQLVFPDYSTPTFKNAPRDTIQVEHDAISTLKKLHNKLWNFYVLYKRKSVYEKDEELNRKIREFCEEKFKDLETFKKFFNESQLISASSLIKNSTPSKMKVLQERVFDVAVSFPGEKRDYVEEVVDELSKHIKKGKIFYDRYFTAELAMPNMNIVLQNVYHHQSKLIVPFFCREYKDKEWPGLEWRAISDLIKKKKHDQIMPFRFDNVEIDGIYSTDGYIDADNTEPRQAAIFIFERLKLLKLNKISV